MRKHWPPLVWLALCACCMVLVIECGCGSPSAPSDPTPTRCIQKVVRGVPQPPLCPKT